MPNRAQVRNAVLKNLDSEGLRHFKAENVNDAIQDGYHEVAALVLPFDSMAEVNVLGKTPYYDFYSLINNYIGTFAIYGSAIDNWLDFDSVKGFDQTSDRWECETGNPRNFAVINFRYIAINPVPVSDEGKITVYYHTLPSDLDDSVNLEFEEIEPDTLENYATADLLEQSEEFGKAQRYREDYMKAITRGQRLSHARDAKDRILQLWGGVGFI